MGAGLFQSVRLEVLKLDPQPESGQPYTTVLTITDEMQLGDIARTLNIDAPRTPATFCIPDIQLHFYFADGSVQELGYMCDEAQPTLSGEQAFWNGQEAQAPVQFVALIASHLGSGSND